MTDFDERELEVRGEDRDELHIGDSRIILKGAIVA